MPTYIYKCLECKAEFEEEMDRESKRTPPCPECENKNTRKIVKPSAIIFKGKGFTKSVEDKE